MEGSGWQGPALAMGKRDRQAGIKEDPVPRPPPFPPAEWGAGTLDSHLPLRKKHHHPSWVSVVLGWPCCLTSWDRALAPPHPSPGARQVCTPAADKAPFFVHSIIGHLLAAEPVPGAGESCHSVFPWVSAHTSEPPGPRPAQTLSPYAGQPPVEHERHCPFYLHVFRVMPSPDRHVCFAHRYSLLTGIL